MIGNKVLIRESAHWTARTLSVVSTLMLLLFLFGEPFPVTKIRPVEWLGLALFPGGIVLGFGVAWWREGLGGMITIGSLLIFYLVFVLLPSGSFSKGGWFFVFAIPGFLFLISWSLRRSQKVMTA
ncbi:MAG TPA: hypothetical protein VIG25_21020 [Pyrinomonadaceae bacterium]